MRDTFDFEGESYVVATILAKDAKDADFSEADGKPLPQKEFNMRIVSASLVAGGHENGEEITGKLPYFGAYQEALLKAFTVNGISTGKPSGKDAAVTGPAPE